MRTVHWLLVLALVPAGVSAQFGPPPGTSNWGFLVDSVSLDLSRPPAWRGAHHDGDFLIRAGLDVAIYGYAVVAAGNVGGTAAIRGFRIAGAPDGEFGGRMAAELELYRRFGQARLGLLAAPYLLPWDDDGGGVEVGLGLRGVPVPWLPEVRPTLDLVGITDFGAFDGTLLHLALRQVPGLGPVAIPLAVEAWGGDWGGGPFEYRAWQVSFGVAWDPGTGRGGAQMGRDPDAGVFRLRLMGFRLDSRSDGDRWGVELHLARTF